MQAAACKAAFAVAEGCFYHQHADGFSGRAHAQGFQLGPQGRVVFGVSCEYPPRIVTLDGVAHGGHGVDSGQDLDRGVIHTNLDTFANGANCKSGDCAEGIRKNPARWCC